MSSARSPYDVLGVAIGSEDVVIQAAYRALMQKYHPDKVGDDPASMKRAQAINDAFAVLRDPKKRTDLDARLTAAARPAPAEPARAGVAAASERKPWSPGGVLGTLACFGILAALAFLSTARSARDPGPPVIEPTQAAVVAEASVVVDTLPRHTIHEWSADKLPSAPIVIDGITLTLFSRPTPSGALPVIRVTDERGATHEAQGVMGFSVASASFAVGKLDAASDASQVLFMTFSGGAHCCTNVVVLDRIDGRWRTIELGNWDGEGFRTFPRDLDGDDSVEFEFVDNRFLYAFASYAESWAPTLIQRLHNGQVSDVSTRREFRQVHIDDMTRSEPGCRDGNNGACAAYVASAARAGRLNDAWAYMLAHYDRTSSWSLPTGCRIATDGACPESLQLNFATFPEALQYFLGGAGYMATAFVPSSQANGRPSFECARVTSAVLQLVCDTPLLADADRQLAIIYTRAMAFSGDRAALQRGQQSFVRDRNNLPADVTLIAQAYAQRTSDLSAMSSQW